MTDAGWPRRLPLHGRGCATAIMQLRPDDNGKVIQGIPYGQICADHGPVPPDGQGPPAAETTAARRRTTWRTASSTGNRPSCPEGYAYQCYGPNRPEVNNPGSDVRQRPPGGRPIHYCCHARSPAQPAACRPRAPPTCMGGLIGWVCPTMPVDFVRGARTSAPTRAAPTTTTSCAACRRPRRTRDNVYCCFSPSPVLPGGSCVYSPGSAKAVDCGAGRFAFACYGRDTPTGLLPAVSNATSPVQGQERHGYPTPRSTAATTSPPGSGPAPEPTRTTSGSSRRQPRSRDESH